MKEKFLHDLDVSLKSARMKTTSKKFVEKALGISSLFSLFVWLVVGLIFGEMIASFFYGIIRGMFCFCLFLYYPTHKKKSIASAIEGNLPVCLIGIAAELNMGIPLEKALKNSSKITTGILDKEIQQILLERREHGTPLQESLFRFAERTNSLNVKRSIFQLTHALDQGNKKNPGQPIKRIGKELLSKQIPGDILKRRLYSSHRFHCRAR